MSNPIFKNPRQEKRLINQRVIIASVVVLCLIVILLIRLAYLQFLKHHYYSNLAKENRVEILPVSPVRGLIYDRHGVLLARNVPVFSLEITPSAVDNLKKTIDDLAKLLDLSEKEIRLFYRSVRQQPPFQSTPIILKLSEKQMSLFSINHYRFPYVEIKARLLRDYPFNTEFAHVLGYVGRVNASERQKLDPQEYRANDYIGKTNIEYYYEKDLHGQVGYKQIEIDARGNIIKTLKIIPAVSGKNLYLTLDEHLQSIAIKKFGKFHGAMIALDPNNGEILAMVSTPSFDPNLFVQGILQTDYDALMNDPSHPMYNRALNGLYPPGSTIKPFLGVAALGDNIVRPTDRIFDPGYFTLKNSTHIFHDWNHKGHGWVNLHRAIVVSCDTYFYWLSLQMKISGIHKALSAFGFGKKTGIDLPREPEGIAPNSLWKEKHAGQSWYPGDTLNTSIGQGFVQASPLQLALATASLAMRGTGYQPHLLYRAEDIATSTSSVFPNKITTQIHYQDNDMAFSEIIEAMQDVIRSPEGTGTKFGKNATYSVAAKTGTAQVYSIKDNTQMSSLETLRDHGLFIAFAPVDQPKIVVVVVAEHTGEVAPIVARHVMDAFFSEKKIGND